jgi:hypothetical protein
MLFIKWTLFQICFFEIIRVEGGVKFMEHLKGGASYKSLGSSGVDVGIALSWISTVQCS